MKLMILFIIYQFMASSHPLFMLIWLIIITLLSAFYMKFMINFTLSFYIFLLMMISGLLILFSYIASLTGSELMKINPSYSFYFFIFIIWFLSFMEDFEEYHSIIDIYMSNNSMILIFLSFYLMILMIMVPEICSKMKGALKIF